MSDLEHARSLLKMARADLNALRGMLSPALSSSESLFTDGVFGFHAQQAAEKCLKAWIASLGNRYPHTHDLMALIEILVRAGEDTSGLDALVDLTPFAVQYRYESLDTDEDELDRSALLTEMQALFDRVESWIGAEEIK
jgi:HEPN domain-containing protein